MGRRLKQIATAASAGALALTSCATNDDEPATFAATVTITGEADQASADSGECTIGEAHVTPNDEVAIFGASGRIVGNSTLEVESIQLNPDGTDVCTYSAHFESIGANQRSYDIWVNNYFAPQPFTSDELKNGATYNLHSAIPITGDTGTDMQDSGGTP
ncbi:hypothetical protein [Rhodococcus oryzae]|jgi:hypothetical protein|uniref:hypothetical protein n=1 Tax=Rhodococcus oryzae TaxID=2571143 RepID=UPI0037AF655A